MFCQVMLGRSAVTDCNEWAATVVHGSWLDQGPIARQGRQAAPPSDIDMLRRAVNRIGRYRYSVKTGKPSIEQQYQRKNPREHVLLRPEVYVGPLDVQSRQLWVWDTDRNRIVNRLIQYVPGLYKIFDEILVNAADNQCRDVSAQAAMSYIKVDIDENSGSISIENDGHALPVVLHSSEKMYIPELLFGHLLTSSNYDDGQTRFTGGRHGYGAKLVNIFSKYFRVQVYDGDRRLEFNQIYTDNMAKRSPASIVARAPQPDQSHSWTRITFHPDMKRFGCQGFDPDMLSLMRRRVVDVAVCHPDLNVFLNGDTIAVPSLTGYMALHDGLNPDEFVTLELNDRWKVGIGPSYAKKFQQTSFVNNIATLRGGSHVERVLNQVRLALCETVKKNNVVISAQHVRDLLHLFVICKIPNPSFESQTKEMLTTKDADFLSDSALKPSDLLSVTGNDHIIQLIMNAASRQQAQVIRKSDGRKTRHILVPKLEDANFAGGRRASECCLILTEGDSAKALAVSGLSVLGRDTFGVYPLKGKVLNVREATPNQLMNNQFIALKKILGLQSGKVYDNLTSLRYGKIMLMADQDHDGSHIKGLVINLFHRFWPELLRQPGFLTQFVTPIVIARKGAERKQFFTMPEFVEWRQTHPDWTTKYYKGLGTSTSAEAKQYFSNLSTHEVAFTFGESAVDDDLIDLCFNSTRAGDRKSWLAEITPDTHIDYTKGFITLNDFVNKEFILFSMADNVRSIPSLVDGLKPGQRKILFSCFKRKLFNEIKVAQLAGYVAEHSAYHHGEVSLCQTIVGLAQNYVGSNNINLLLPNGQFGTRHALGKDAASSRYIFTCLSKTTRLLFPVADDDLLSYASDDDMLIEPHWYIPIIPLAVVNGSTGIGTGWSSFIPNYNPKQVIDCLRHIISGKKYKSVFTPFLSGFKGKFTARHDKENICIGFTSSGVIKQVDGNTVDISELPIGRSTEAYKLFLDQLIVDGTIYSYTAHHTDDRVRFLVKCAPKPQRSTAQLIKSFHLTSVLPVTNMVLFDADGVLRRFSTVHEIITSFFDVRLAYYVRRKAHLELAILQRLEFIRNRVRFVEGVLDESIAIRNIRRTQLVDELDRSKFRLYDGSFDYLLNMPLAGLTKERVMALSQSLAAAENDLESVRSVTPQEMWLADLDKLLESLDNNDQCS